MPGPGIKPGNRTMLQPTEPHRPRCMYLFFARPCGTPSSCRTKHRPFTCKFGRKEILHPICGLGVSCIKRTGEYTQRLHCSPPSERSHTPLPPEDREPWCHTEAQREVELWTLMQNAQKCINALYKLHAAPEPKLCHRPGTVFVSMVPASRSSQSIENPTDTSV